MCATQSLLCLEQCLRKKSWQRGQGSSHIGCPRICREFIEMCIMKKIVQTFFFGTNINLALIKFSMNFLKFICGNISTLQACKSREAEPGEAKLKSWLRGGDSRSPAVLAASYPGEPQLGNRLSEQRWISPYPLNHKSPLY